MTCPDPGAAAACRARRPGLGRWRYPLLIVLVAAPLLAAGAEETADPAQEEAVRALRGVASNLQRNRDGSVRFVRLSRQVVTDEHLVHLRAFPRLDYLAVVTPGVTDRGLRHLAELRELDTLVLSDSGATDQTLALLPGLPKLETLFLDRLPLTDAGLEPLARLPKLKMLSLAGTRVTGGGLRHLRGLERLEVLVLDDSPIGDAGLAEVAHLPALRVLHCRGTRVAGDGVQALAMSPQLQELALDRTPLTAEALAPLAAVETLTQLLLRDTGVRREQLAGLQAALPKLQLTLAPPPGQQRSVLERYLAGEPLRGAPAAGDGAETSPPSASPSPAAASASPSDAARPVRLPIDQRLEGADEVPDFQRHVMPLLGTLGCNGRTCHGSFQGKGGFNLSMFGYDFAADHQALTGGDSPRVSRDRPADSLLVTKPTSADDHGGGQRFAAGSWQQRVLLRWIAGGASGLPDGDRPRRLVRLEVSPRELVFKRPGASAQLRCVAIWDDGVREDVTPLTRFETNDDQVARVDARGQVRAQGPGDTHVVAFYDAAVVPTAVMLPVSPQHGEAFPMPETTHPVDQLVVAKLAKLGIVPAPRCGDSEFLRRVSLDLTGTLPSPQEVREFQADRSPDKRSRKIDQLLESPAYTEWWTVKLSDLTGSNAQYLGTTDMNTPAAQQWNAWLRRRLADNVGWDRIAAGILLAVSRRPGQSYADYAAEQSLHLRTKDPTDFTALENPLPYYWFRSNNQQPTDRALAFGYVFLGVRLQCAQCHKHPFDQWSQQDFELLTQFFQRVKAGVAPWARASQQQLKQKLGVPEKLDTAALRRQMYLRVSAEGLPIPWNEIWLEPPGAQPHLAKVLGGEPFDLNQFADPREPLAAWLFQPENPYFGRAMVNRIWHHYFGVGIVEPPDDLNRANPPSNAPLLDWLNREFVAHRYDLKWLHRTILNSATYQRSWQTNETNAADRRNFARALVRRLPAEVTIDAIRQATASEDANRRWLTAVADRKIAQHPRSIQARGIDYSLLVFGKPLRTTNCDCERQQQPTLLQSLYVRNDRDIFEWLERKDGWLQQLAGRHGWTLVSDLTPPPAASGREASREKKEAGDGDPSAGPRLHRQWVEEAYLRTLSRLPTEREHHRAAHHFQTLDQPLEALRDLLWALVNSDEFLTNH